MKAEKQYRKEPSHTIQVQKTTGKIIGHPIVQRYILINFQKESLPKRLLTCENEVFKTILCHWYKDPIAHSYQSWEEVEGAINEMIAIKKTMEIPLGNAQKIVDNFHATQQGNPSWVEEINRTCILISAMIESWAVAPPQFKAITTRLTYLLANPQAARVPLAPIPAPSSARLPEMQDLPQLEAPNLTGMKKRLFDRNHDTRFQAIGALRGTDDDQYIQDDWIKGAILAPFIADSRRAIANLVRVLGDTVAIFSLERGGSLLADHLHRARRDLLNVKIPKSQVHHTREEQHLRLMLGMMDAEEGLLFKMLSRKTMIARTAPLITFAITETAISGSSVNTLLKTLKRFSSLLPYTRFRLLIEKQTMKDNDFSPAAPSHLKVSDPKIRFGPILYEGKPLEGNIAQIEMFIAQTQYIIGEDVGYQVSYDIGLKGAPLVVFDETATGLVAVKLHSGSMLPREMIIELIAGAYDDILNEKRLL